MDRKPWQPRGRRPGCDGHQTRRQRYYYRRTINAATGVTVFGGRGGGRGDPPRCPWNSYYNEIVLFGGVKLVGRGGEISYFFLFVTFFRKYSI